MASSVAWTPRAARTIRREAASQSLLNCIPYMGTMVLALGGSGLMSAAAPSAGMPATAANERNPVTMGAAQLARGLLLRFFILRTLEQLSHGCHTKVGQSGYVTGATSRVVPADKTLGGRSHSTPGLDLA